MCICCDDVEALPGRPYCARCLFAIRADVDRGLRELDDYLRAWAAFGDWCAERGLSTV
jgi:hypothetical protein